MRGRRLRIGFLTGGDGRRRSSWSGIPFYMARALERHGEVVHLGPVTPLRQRLGRVRSRLLRFITGRRLPYHHSLSLARDFASAFERRLRDVELDLLFAPVASTEIALLETELPIVYTSDTTLALMEGYYPWLVGVDEKHLRDAREVEGLALDRADVLLYPTEWAIGSAVGDYGVPRDRIRLAPYGANLDAEVIPDGDPDSLLSAKPAGRCAVTFLGVDWDRKGGDVAVEAVRLLRDRGLEAELTVAGCRPPEDSIEPWMRVIPRFDKSDPAQQRALSRLLLESSFLLLPTRQECYGIVFCEASAHGTPSVAPDTGGVGGVVVDGENGCLLPSEAPPEQYAERMAELLEDRQRYEALVVSSRRRYDRTLSWDRWSEVAGEALAEVLP